MVSAELMKSLFSTETKWDVDKKPFSCQNIEKQRITMQMKFWCPCMWVGSKSHCGAALASLESRT